MSNKRILVVDDEFRIRKLLVDFLKREDYETVEAKDGEEALDILFEQNQSFDLIILDVMMPKYDGWYVLESVRDYMTTPVVMLTARSDEYDQLKGFRMGADDYVTKPFSPSVLMARINKILKRDKEDIGGVVTFNATIKNQKNEDVAVMTMKVMLHKKG